MHFTSYSMSLKSWVWCECSRWFIQTDDFKKISFKFHSNVNCKILLRFKMRRSISFNSNRLITQCLETKSWFCFTDLCASLCDEIFWKLFADSKLWTIKSNENGNAEDGVHKRCWMASIQMHAAQYAQLFDIFVAIF